MVPRVVDSGEGWPPDRSTAHRKVIPRSDGSVSSTGPEEYPGSGAWGYRGAMDADPIVKLCVIMMALIVVAVVIADAFR